MNFSHAMRRFAVLACLAVTGQAWAQTPAPQQADVAINPFANRPDAVSQGAALFDRTCSACHGTGATGGRGPALTNGVFKHGGSDYDIFPTIKRGVPGTEMPSFATLPSDDVWRLVTYIKSLSGRGRPGQVDRRRQGRRSGLLRRGGCTGCHEVNGRGSDLATDLSAEGAKPAGAIRDGVLHQHPPPRSDRVPRLLDVTDEGRPDRAAAWSATKTVSTSSWNSRTAVVDLSTRRDRQKVTPAGNAGPAISQPACHPPMSTMWWPIWPASRARSRRDRQGQSRAGAAL